ncbi:2-phosphosulfolactate phosphatase [Nocardioides immobilis]|uniref:Probable 2-phosphosulfolactate phosphatase n=1 Tax=Nocardioides immobilis TaxID=2049295 RepID=A0A417Y1J5_9ACTN|nr:2-phosphosulfolactate phosphatase [Nocardioides immobilis]RHW26539.1 2-phosphosulfolactate phosphatase [Nocardioides immobilis]
MTTAHGQATYDVRLDWGPTGGAAVARGADVAVVVDVLSFTSTLGIAVARGTRVHPFPWKDERAAAFAAERDAVLAVGRFEAAGLADPPPSLSPAQLLSSTPVERLVLPSPNGSTICAALAGPVVVGASLRNRTAVARWLRPHLDAGAVVAFVPAGERWPDGSLRPGLEDLWGAGAVLAALDLTDRSVSPEARHAAASYASVAGDLRNALADCASGRELAEGGYAADVEAAADIDAEDVVPVLTDDGFVAG